MRRSSRANYKLYSLRETWEPFSTGKRNHRPSEKSCTVLVRRDSLLVCCNIEHDLRDRRTIYSHEFIEWQLKDVIRLSSLASPSNVSVPRDSHERRIVENYADTSSITNNFCENKMCQLRFNVLLRDRPIKYQL